MGDGGVQAWALIVKGYLCNVKTEHKKTSAWFTMALSKCTKSQKPYFLLNIGAYLRIQGEYSKALSFINQAKSLAKDLFNDLPFQNSLYSNRNN